MRFLMFFIMLLVSSLFVTQGAELKGNLADYGVRAGDPSFDNGIVINNACKFSSELFLPEGTYYFNTPIELKSIRSIYFLGNLVYTGKNGVSAITISGNNISVNFVGYISAQKGKISYAKYDERNSTVGVDFVNMNNSTVFVNEVRYFNENIRVSGIGAGCSYNKFSFGMIRNSNVGLRIYQRDEGGKRGWANENTFIGGRFCNYADWNKAWPTLAVRIAGPDNQADSYHIANSLFFLKQSFENYDTVIYARNVRESDFLYSRLEGSKVFVQFVGSCRQNRVNCDYQGSCKLYTDEESNTIPIRLSDSPFVPIAQIDIKSSTKIISSSEGKVYLAEGFGFAPLNNPIGTALRPYISESEKNKGYLPSIICNTSTIKTFRVVLDKPGIVYVSYLDYERGAVVPKTDTTDTFVSDNTTGVFHINLKKVYVYFRVPNNVNKIQISVASNIDSFQVLSKDWAAPLEIPQIKTSGSKEERPLVGYPGQMFFDETLRRYFFWDGQNWSSLGGSSLL